MAMVFEPSTYLRNRKRNNIVWERQTLENIMEIMGNILTKIIYHENPILFKDISCFLSKITSMAQMNLFKFEKRQTQNLI